MKTIVNRRNLNRGEYHKILIDQYGWTESGCKRLATIEALEQTLDQEKEDLPNIRAISRIIRDRTLVLCPKCGEEVDTHGKCITPGCFFNTF